MNKEFRPNDAAAENEELLLALESAEQKLQSSSQQVAELTKRLAETAMARVEGRRRIDLRALRSMDMEPGKYEISVSEPDAPDPQVVLTWMPGTLILGPDLVATPRDVKLLLPTVRAPRIWQIPSPPNTMPPPLPPVVPESMDQEKWVERGSKERARMRAWTAHHLGQTQAAEGWASTDGPQAGKDEEQVAEAMMAEIEARRADPQVNVHRTIMDVGQALARRLMTANRKN